MRLLLPERVFGLRIQHHPFSQDIPRSTCDFAVHRATLRHGELLGLAPAHP